MALPVRALVLQKIGNLHWKVEVSFLLSIRLFREIRLFEGRCFCLQLLPFSYRQQLAAFAVRPSSRTTPWKGLWGTGCSVPSTGHKGLESFPAQSVPHRVSRPASRHRWSVATTRSKPPRSHSQTAEDDQRVPFAKIVVQFCCYGGKRSSKKGNVKA